MKVNERSLLFLIGLGVGLVSGCGGGGGSGSSSKMEIVEVSNGFGRLLPYQIAERDALGNPSSLVIEITRIEDLLENLTPNNPILPPTKWPETAILPNNLAGNHFIYVRFSQPIDIDSVLTPAVSAAVDSNLRGSIKVASVDPSTSRTIDITGRGFVGGKTYGPTIDPNNASNFKLEAWVTLDKNLPADSNLVATTIDGDQPGLGFPGVGDQAGFAGDDVLVDDHTFVFVIDTAGGLSTLETFPAGLQIQMRINENVRGQGGRELAHVGLASSTVGDDTVPPEVRVSGATQTPIIIPGNFEENVDPETNIEVQFTEPVQLLTVGELDDGKPPELSSAIQVQFGPDAMRVSVPYSVRPFSVFDLTRLELVPAYNFPGSGPTIGGLTCGSFGKVDVTVFAPQFADLNGTMNTLSPHTEFTTREGVGLVNAPVTPETIYVGRGGSVPGISVIDLNGFGGGTGNPTFVEQHPIRQGNTNYPNNPNVKILGSVLIPPLTPGTCTINGGSEGPFTLTRDSSLSDLLARSPLLLSVGDMALGHALDNTFNNASPFGCQSGGGNICASTGLKLAQLAAGGPNALAPSTTSTLPTKIVSGGENLVTFAPSPNPPPISFPPLCQSPLINAQEPTSTFSGTPILLGGGGFINLLVPGANNRGNLLLERPPTNLLVASQNAYFDGPSPPQPTITACLKYRSRQQVGHFLYVADRVAREVVVLNSNRFTVIDRIPMTDPTSFAMSPNLDLLAVTNESADQVAFVDVDPSSSTFHKIVRTVTVGAGPTGIAWETGNEDIFVCNQEEGTVTILSAFSLRPRKVIRNQITRPIDVALTPRQLGFGFSRGVYFGYILNQSGSLAFFESGPDGINGWGFDDTIGTLPFPFTKPRAIQVDSLRSNSAVWIAHEMPLNADGLPTGQTGGALSNVGIASGTSGITFITGVLSPQIRNLAFGVFASVGEGTSGLSGVPVDMAFDNMLNVSALTNYTTQFSAGQALSINGKALIRFTGGNFISTFSPQFMFLAVPNPGVVDVLKLSTGTVQRVDTSIFETGIQSIPAPNVNVVADYFRQ